MDEDAKISDDVLNKAPGRALDLLSGISRNPIIRQHLIPYGYTDAVHEEGWRLLNATGGRVRPVPQAATPAPPDVSTAQTELVVWGTRAFAVADASLRHAFPAQHAYVFQGDLKMAQGNEAVLAVSTFLDRVDGLVADPARKKSRAEDEAALVRLEERSITAKERAHASELVATIQAGAQMPVVPPTPKVVFDHQAAKLALYQWFDEWSSIAHVAITRRDLLIRIGLASPRSRKAAKEPAKPAAKDESRVVAAPVRTVPPGRPSAAPAPVN